MRAKRREKEIFSLLSLCDKNNVSSKNCNIMITRGVGNSLPKTGMVRGGMIVLRNKISKFSYS